jgi:putative transposase
MDHNNIFVEKSLTFKTRKNRPDSYLHPSLRLKNPDSLSSHYMTSMLLTRKIRIIPTPQQEQVLWILSEKCRLLYNLALAERQQNWEVNREKPKEERTYINYITQQNALPAIKVQYPEYAWVYSKVLQMILRRLDADFKSFFARWSRGDHQARPPRYKGKRYFTTLCFNQSGFKLDMVNQTLCFSHKHPSGVEFQFDLPWLPPITGKIKQVELFQDKSCQWFVSITIDEQVPTYEDNGRYQAIDLGIINLVTAVNLQGKFIQISNRRPDKYWRKKIREVQFKRNHCIQFSNNWYRYTAKLQKMQRKLAHQLRDFQHKISKCVVENTRANILIIGTLDIKAMSRKKKTTGQPRQSKAIKTLHYSVQNTGFLGRFAEFLTYKARKVGKSVVRIDEAYTTKTCCVCGKVQDRYLSECDIRCDCGTSFDRDQNAAVNIMIRFLSQQSPVNGESLQVFLNGLHRNTALPHFSRGVDSMEIPATMQG